jgi:hypothetical protein
MAQPQLDHGSLEAITSGGATPTQLDHGSFEIIISGGATPSQLDQLCLEVIVRINQLLAVEGVDSTAICNNPGVKLATPSVDATAEANGPALKLGTLSVDATASANVGIALGILGVDSSAIATSTLGLRLGVGSVDATAEVQAPTVSMGALRNPDELLEASGPGELVEASGPGELCEKSGGLLEIIGDSKVYYETIRGSCRPPFETVIKDFFGNPIDLTTAEEVWLIVAGEQETPTANLTLKLELSFVTPRDEHKGQVYRTMQSADTSSVEPSKDPKSFFGQVHVKWDSVNWSKHGEVEFVIAPSTEHES